MQQDSHAEDRVLRCAHCKIHLAMVDDIVSKTFHGRRGRAFLLHAMLNVNLGRSEKRTLMTGLHVVADVRCTCNRLIGWYYERAHDASQKYKEGKYVAEKFALSCDRL